MPDPQFLVQKGVLRIAVGVLLIAIGVYPLIRIIRRRSWPGWTYETAMVLSPAAAGVLFVLAGATGLARAAMGDPDIRVAILETTCMVVGLLGVTTLLPSQRGLRTTVMALVCLGLLLAILRVWLAATGGASVGGLRWPIYIAAVPLLLAWSLSFWARRRTPRRGPPAG
jgi:hypothetical protein